MLRLATPLAVVPIVGFGLMAAFTRGWFDDSKVHVTYFGSSWVAETSAFDFDDCSTFFENGQLQTEGDCDYEAPNPEEPMECDHTLTFRSRDADVQRLRARFLLMRDGKQVGRGLVTIDSVSNGDDAPPTSREVRGDCAADQLILVEATAMIDGAPTDLIATEAIQAKGLIPFFPDFFIKIGPAAET